MGFRFIGSEYLSGKLQITRRNAAKLYDKHRDCYGLAELNFIDTFRNRGEFKSSELLEDPDRLLEIDSPDWYGEGSRDTEVFENLLKHTQGTAEILLWGEGGTVLGIAVCNGTVQRKNVKLTLE